MAEAPKKVRGVFERPTGSGVWWIQYFDHGRRHRERVGTKSNAASLYQKRRTQILLGDKMPELQRKRVTLGELIDDAILYATEHNKSAKDYRIKGELLRKSFGQREADEIKPEEFAAWVRRRGVSAATFNRYRSFLSLCFRQAIKSGKASANPARMLTQKKEPRGRKRFLSREEYDKVLKVMTATHPKRVPAFILSVFTGMRLMEQYRLRWKDIDFDRRELHVSGSKNGEDRSVPLASVALAVLRDLVPKNVKPGALLFPRKYGGKVTIRTGWFTALMAQQDLAIEDYTWHNNRHTFCSWLAIAGTPLRTIQELAGHKTITITARYAHLSPDHKSIEIEKLVALPKAKLLQFPETEVAV